MQNPLLDLTGLPPFSTINASHVKPAVEQQLTNNRQIIEQLLQQPLPFTWNNLIQPLEIIENQLEKLWSPVSHMNAVVNSNELREAYNQCLPMLSDYHTEIGQNKALYLAILDVYKKDQSLSAAQRKSLEDNIRGFKLSGVDLPEAEQVRFKALSQKLSQLSSRYSDNVLDATNHWTLQIQDETQLSGLPESAKAMAAQTAKERDLEGWLLTLEYPSFHAIITYADDRSLREKMYKAFTTKASDQAEQNRWDNQAIMQEIMALRKEMAALLGFSNYAELSLDSKMAEDPEKVIDFLNQLAAKSKPIAEQEISELAEFAKHTLSLETLEAWDVSYVSEKLKQKKYAISDEDLKPYFPVDQVIQGLFKLVQQLFNIRIEQVTNGIDLWHKDVRYYEIKNNSGELLASFYFDLYARQHKRGGAWMDSYCSRFHDGKTLQLPVAYMTCNSTPPIGDDPALFTHYEVETIFHEFGHGLHHMLTQINHLDISGINGVEWDAVELPSQFMENWCWERDALNLFAKHYQTGDTIPEPLFDKMLASKNYHSAMGMVRQLEFSLFDMQIHLADDADQAHKIHDILQTVRKQVSVITPPDYNRFENSFGHIFSGGYAAGYYSYKWAEVLSADAFERFKEEGIFNPEVGKTYYQEILSVGGSRPAMESFKAFRGREPSVDALLKHAGLDRAA